VTDDAFRPGTHRLHVESVGRTSVLDAEGTMVVRVSQNDQGFDLPPDLVGGAPKHQSRAMGGQLVTLIDMDHFVEGKFEPDTNWVLERAYALHDDLIETFHKYVITEQAVEAWR
jgi:uncharacterized protein (TIGR04255 family)